MERLNIFTEELLAPAFDLLEACRGVEQMEKHHPEGDVFTHSLQVVWHALRETDDVDLILAALLHDVGKAVMKLGHDEKGAELLRDCATVKTLFLVEQHMRIHSWINGDMKRPGKARAMAEHPWLPELVQLSRWDAMGRVAGKKVTWDRQKFIDTLNEKAAKHFGKAGGKKDDSTPAAD